MTNNNSFSEKYNKTLVQIVFSSNEYYTAYGIDPKLGDGDVDVYLSDGKGVLLFTSLEYLKTYANKQDSFVFDDVNFRKWINGLPSNASYISYDFDLVESKLKKWTVDSDILAEENEDLLYKLFEIILFGQDMKYQFFDKEVERILDLKEIDKFTDTLYDHFIWASDDKDKVRRELSAMMKEPSLVENILRLFKRIYPLFLI